MQRPADPHADTVLYLQVRKLTPVDQNHALRQVTRECRRMVAEG